MQKAKVTSKYISRDLSDSYAVGTVTRSLYVTGSEQRLS